MDLPLPLNYVFVDYENMQVVNLDVIGSKGVAFTLLLGPMQKELKVELVEQLMTHAASVEMIRITTQGNNALDFTLAYYLGRAVAADPRGFFHIISKDKGYDPMITHLRSRRIRVRRHDDFSKLELSASPKQPIADNSFIAPLTSAKPKEPAIKQPFELELSASTKQSIANDSLIVPLASVKPEEPAIEDPFERVLKNLRKNPNNRPKNNKKLVSYLYSSSGKNCTANHIAKIIQEWRRKNYISIDEKGAVTYKL